MKKKKSNPTEATTFIRAWRKQEAVTQSGMLTPRSTALIHPSIALIEDSMTEQ